MQITQKTPVFTFSFEVDQFKLSFSVEAPTLEEAKKVLAGSLTKVIAELEAPTPEAATDTTELTQKLDK
jgi:hypothetical protein